MPCPPQPVFCQIVVATDQDARARVEKSRRYLESGNDYHRRFLDEWLPDRGLVADVGCGDGRVGTFYHRPERPVVGVEIDMALAAAVGSDGRCPVVVGDALTLPFATGSLAAYVGLGVVEFGPDCVLSEASRVLLPGGLLYLSVTYANVARSTLGRTATWRGNPVPTFNAASITKLLTRHGFSVTLVRRSSLGWGLGPLRPLTKVFRAALLREDDTSLSYRLIAPIARPWANSLLVVGHRQPSPARS